MAGWKDMLLDVLRLTDEVKRMNRDKYPTINILTFYLSFLSYSALHK